uniref:D3 n=1 Tax=Arundo donax TaxID=35708 RepID=A0A0A9FRJ2_ARUDO
MILNVIRRSSVRNSTWPPPADQARSEEVTVRSMKGR